MPYATTTSVHILYIIDSPRLNNHKLDYETKKENDKNARIMKTKRVFRDFPILTG